MKVVGWIAKGGMKYFDQAAIIIALTLGKAMGSAGHAMCWAALLISKLPERAIMDVQPDTKQHPILARMPMLGEYCTMDAAFELVDKHPEGAVIAHSDTEHLMERHIKHKDKKFHLWCKEIDEAIKTITPEHERDALTLKGGCNMILSAGCHSDGGMNTSMRNPGTYRFRDPYKKLLVKNKKLLVKNKNPIAFMRNFLYTKCVCLCVSGLFGSYGAAAAATAANMQKGEECL